ncbi:MAG: YqzL family protein [Clostridia bacterium]|nr:YqzL family protein [Clostridia bacterium]
MDKKNKSTSPAQKAWELFSKTGNVSHYLFYKQLDKD